MNTQLFLMIKRNKLERHPTRDAFIIDRKVLLDGVLSLRRMYEEMTQLMGGPESPREVVKIIQDQVDFINQEGEFSPRGKRQIKL